MHIDLNTFFVRAEEIKNPSLEGKPVGIGHLGRGGIISTCSYEARRFGVRSGMPSFQATKLCPQLILLDGDYQFYNVLSLSFYSFLKRRFKVVERASIDECYVDVTNDLNNLTENEVRVYLKQMQNDLFQELSLKSSIGIGPTRFLAKMGSDYQKPMGLTILRARDIDQTIGRLKIEDMYGVGKKTAPRLKLLGINTIGDLKKRINEEDQVIKDELGKVYYTYKEWLNGHGDDVVDDSPVDPKSISHATTLKENTNRISELKEVLKELCEAVSAGANKQKMKGYVVQVTLKDNEFKSRNKQQKMQRATNEAKEIYDRASKILQEMYNPEEMVRLIGVGLHQLIRPKDEVIQMTFYDYLEHEEVMRTKLIINDINRKVGKPVLKRASEVKKGKDKKKNGEN